MTMKAFRAWLVFIGWLALTVFLSCQSYSGSTEISTGLARAVHQGFGWLFGRIDVVEFHRVFRKVGHFVAHFGVGLFGLRAFLKTARGRERALTYALMTGIFVAIFDEAMQLLVEGRVSDAFDGLLNVSGVVLGIMVVWYFTKARR